jgi:hypothetical protein
MNEGKFHHITGHEGPEGEWNYSSTLSLTSALYGVDDRQVPAALPPHNDTVSTVQGSGWAGLDGCEKFRLHRDSIAGFSSP